PEGRSLRGSGSGPLGARAGRAAPAAPQRLPAQLQLIGVAQVAHGITPQAAAAAEQGRLAPARGIGWRQNVAVRTEDMDSELDALAAFRARVDQPELRDAGLGIERRQAAAVLALGAVADHLDDQVGGALQLDEG